VEQEKTNNGVYAQKLKAGKRRTYFFDVRATKSNDYYLTITESIKNREEQYERHKIFLYKEDMVRFVTTLEETIQYIKSELLPDYDFNNTYIHKDGEGDSKEETSDSHSEDSWN